MGTGNWNNSQGANVKTNDAVGNRRLKQATVLVTL